MTSRLAQMGPLELEARSALLALYLDAPVPVAEDVGRRVLAAFDEIRAESERLRAALHEIAEYDECNNGDDCPAEMQRIAREALP